MVQWKNAGGLNKNIKNSLDDNMEYWQKVHQIPQNDFGW